MPLRIDRALAAQQLLPLLERMFELSGEKILRLERRWAPEEGAPVVTRRGQYGSRGWTDWTEGFQHGSALLQFDATGERRFLELGRRRIAERMAAHISHVGVHDHGFNIVSTFGNWLRLQREGKIAEERWEPRFCELALKISGAIQAARWTSLPDGLGFIHSFNGRHSLFIDTIRSLRSLALAHLLNQPLLGEQDARVSLLERLKQHALTTARYSIFYGEGRDAYDQAAGRAAHEIIFNPKNGAYRCPNSQQGYSPFSTWTRGLAWAMCGFAELLEFLDVSSPRQSGKSGEEIVAPLRRAARAVCDFYLQCCCADGVPVWDTGAPNLWRIPDFCERVSDPFNGWEPVDSSAAAIAAQGLWRFGNYLRARQPAAARQYRQAALTIARTLLQAPYLSTGAGHEGLLLHSVYHRPNGWDFVARGQRIPNGESSMWGDYHLRELGLLLWREARRESYPAFYSGVLSAQL